jgi:hypothetical protein
VRLGRHLGGDPKVDHLAVSDRIEILDAQFEDHEVTLSVET